jgi:hypothetical protein
MSLGDLVQELIFSGIGESIAELSPRRRHTLVGLAGMSLAAGVLATIVRWPAMEDRPMWTVGLTIGALLYGLALGIASGLTLVNDRDDRGFALFALLGCLAAAVLPLVSMVR